MNKNITNDSDITGRTILKIHNQKIIPAPSIEHYCVVNSTPMKIKDIIREYEKSESQEGLIIMHYLKRHSRTIAFRFGSNLHIRRTTNSLEFLAPGYDNKSWSYSGEWIYRMKFLPLASKDQPDNISSWPKELESELIQSFKGLVDSWTYSKEIPDQHLKIARILHKNIPTTKSVSLVRKLNKLLGLFFLA